MISIGFPSIFILFRVKWNVRNDCRSKGSTFSIIFYLLPPLPQRGILYRSVVIFGQCIKHEKFGRGIITRVVYNICFVFFKLSNIRLIGTLYSTRHGKISGCINTQ